MNGKLCHHQWCPLMCLSQNASVEMIQEGDIFFAKRWQFQDVHIDLIVIILYISNLAFARPEVGELHGIQSYDH